MSLFNRVKPLLAHRPIVIEPLEERIVLDASVDAVSQENQDQQAIQDVSEATNPNAQITGAQSAASSESDYSDPVSEIFVQDLSVAEGDCLSSPALDLETDPADHVLSHVIDCFSSRSLQDLNRADLLNSSDRRAFRGH